MTDFKNGGRIKDPELLRQAHWAFDECVLCGGIDISIHHILPRGQGGDDVWENLAPLCGDGTTGCHGGIEHGTDATCYAFGRYLLSQRPDTLRYLRRKLRFQTAVDEFIDRRFLRRYLRVSS
ncbi:MAG TPA: HNH endonuclease signature motif containing protein [Gemmatimonadales bacterium]|nr:HNH endonuclease signature motif containing protein [Gemmatimonadales bacterium]